MQVAARIRNLPPQTTLFIGRQEELAEITGMLSNPACRLLNLVGPGGIGKTRLAIQAAAGLPIEFGNGITFIVLQPLQESASDLVYAIADGLHLPLTGNHDPEEQLIEYLSKRETLIVLDNFDSLVSDTAVELVLRILRDTSQVKLLITSREVLNLQEEWLYNVQGLSPPAGQNPADLEASSAAKLFIERSRQVRRNFSPEQEASGIAQICHLCGGMPLAIELAASWVKTLTCDTIASEIEQNINFLATLVRNIPDRQRSIHAVFEHSWERASQNERIAFKKLSIFRGGFQREAAAKISGASLSDLAGLLDKSLLYFEPGGRYRIHELLRQFGDEKLQQNSSEAILTREKFTAYYLDYVNQRTKDLMAGRQRETSIEIATELENIRLAWKWIAERQMTDGLGQFIMTMSLFFQYQSRYLEGLAMLEKGAQRLAGQSPSRTRDLSLASVQCDISWFLIRLGKLEKAEQSAHASHALTQKHNALPSEVQELSPLLPLGIIASIRGDSAETARLAEVVRQESDAQGHPWNRQMAYYLLTRAALLQGDIENAHRYALQTYTIAQENEDDWFLAYCLTELGNVAYESGDNIAARTHYQASYQLRRDFNDPEGMADALNNLGMIDLLDKNYKQAGDHFRAAEKIYREINDKGGLATSLHGIARVSVAQSDFQTARQAFTQALQISAEIQYFSLCTSVLADIGQLLLIRGNTNQGIEILETIANHPASEPEIREQARRMLPAGQISVPVEETDLPGLVTRLVMHFPEIENNPGALQDTSSPTTQPLIDPLTERELEVLHKIAHGLTNQQISETLFISPGTAKWYSSQIYRKLGVMNRTQAVARARELGLIDR